MAVKTVTLKLEAYERLRSARCYPRESFNDVILHARWADESATGAELLTLLANRGPLFTLDELDELEVIALG